MILTCSRRASEIPPSYADSFRRNPPHTRASLRGLSGLLPRKTGARRATDGPPLYKCFSCLLRSEESRASCTEKTMTATLRGPEIPCNTLRSWKSEVSTRSWTPWNSSAWACLKSVEPSGAGVIFREPPDVDARLCNYQEKCVGSRSYLWDETTSTASRSIVVRGQALQAPQGQRLKTYEFTVDEPSGSSVM